MLQPSFIGAGISRDGLAAATDGAAADGDDVEHAYELDALHDAFKEEWRAVPLSSNGGASVGTVNYPAA